MLKFRTSYGKTGSQAINPYQSLASYQTGLRYNNGTQDVINGVFVNRVATGRKMTFEQVDAIAQGRVWTGADALKLGLVDKIGGLDDAIKEAASLSKTKNYNTKNYPEFEKNFEEFLENFPFAKSKERWIKEEIGEENYKVMEQIKRVQSYKGIQARMPFEINIQ